MALTREQSIELGCVIEERRSALISAQAGAGRELEELRAIEAARKPFAEGTYGAWAAGATSTTGACAPTRPRSAASTASGGTRNPLTRAAQAFSTHLA